MELAFYPYLLLVFWYRDVTFSVAKFSYTFIINSSNLLSAPLLLKTFFKPLKNEYRQGLVLFSIVMGITTKLLLLAVIFLLLSALSALFLIANLVVALLPIIIFVSLFS